MLLTPLMLLAATALGLQTACHGALYVPMSDSSSDGSNQSGTHVGDGTGTGGNTDAPDNSTGGLGNSDSSQDSTGGTGNTGDSPTGSEEEVGSWPNGSSPGSGSDDTSGGDTGGTSGDGTGGDGSSSGGDSVSGGGGDGGDGSSGSGGTTTDPDCPLSSSQGYCPSDVKDPYGSGGGEGEPLPDPKVGDGTVKDDNGHVTLTAHTTSTPYIWAANSAEGTVSRVDMLTGKEVARYSVIAATAKIKGDGKLARGPGCAQPSRTTVDEHGNAYVANRANKDEGWPEGECTKDTEPESQQAYFTNYRDTGSVTKLGLYDPVLCDKERNPQLVGCQCEDTDGDGVVETSKDANADGIIDMNDAAEYLGEADECVLWTRIIPQQPESTAQCAQPCLPENGCSNKSTPRAMAIDSRGTIWVGDHLYGRVYGLTSDGDFIDPDPTNATTYANTNSTYCGTHTNKLWPYGGVVDANQKLWLISREGNILQIDTATGDIDAGSSRTSNNLNTFEGYGITIDDKNTVWLPSSKLTTKPEIGKYPNPTTGDLDVLTASNAADGRWRGRGVTATSDGMVWAVYNTSWAESIADNKSAKNLLVKFDSNNPQATPLVLQVPLDSDCKRGQGTTADGKLCCDAPIGAGVGPQGKIWLVSHNSNNICSYDPATGEWGPSIPIGQRPYTYSDFTGNIFRTFTKPQGKYVLRLLGCESSNFYDVQKYIKLRFRAAMPGASALEVRFRSADTVGDLSVMPLVYGDTFDDPVDPATDLTLDIPDAVGTGDWLEVEFTFKADDAGNKPTLETAEVLRSCVLVGE